MIQQPDSNPKHIECYQQVLPFKEVAKDEDENHILSHQTKPKLKTMLIDEDAVLQFNSNKK